MLFELSLRFDDHGYVLISELVAMLEANPNPARLSREPLPWNTELILNAASLEPTVYQLLQPCKEAAATYKVSPKHPYKIRITTGWTDDIGIFLNHSEMYKARILSDKEYDEQLAEKESKNQELIYQWQDAQDIAKDDGMMH